MDWYIFFNWSVAAIILAFSIWALSQCRKMLDQAIWHYQEAQRLYAAWDEQTRDI